LENEYERLKARVKAEILKAPFISFTIDAWTDEAAKHSLLSVTAHYLDEKMKPSFFVLAAKPIIGRHTAPNMASLLNEVILDYGLDRQRIHLVVRDGASSMQSTVRLAGLESIWCFAHILHLV
jgi:hypothetical protein